jgi:hypothetical protein
MALPIKPKDTQDGCNPISSNCVIWQGPDIACINLCNGDSVSDVVAKLAEELCTIADQLNISLLDLSCFGAISPTPTDFRGVIQLLINNICNIEDGATGGTGGTQTGCPDNCLVNVASCLQTTDALGNLITELPLRDYLLLIGNRVCTIVSQTNTLSSAVTSLQNSVTNIEQVIATPVDTTINVQTGGCIGNNIEVPIEQFVRSLESALCGLISGVGTTLEINQAIAQQCTVDAAPLDQAGQLNAPSVSMSNLPGWVPANSYSTLADAVNNIWLTVCDMREAVRRLQLSNLACCGVTCTDIIWSYTVAGVRSSKFLDFYFSGTVPAGFDYCRGGTGMNITIKDSVGNTGTYVRDIITSINTGAPLAIDIDGTTAIRPQAIWYNISVPLGVCNDEDLECESTRVFELYNEDWCEDRLFNLATTNVVPNVSGAIAITFTAASAVTTYAIQLYQVVSSNNIVPISSANNGTWIFNNITGGNQSYAFNTLFDSGDQFFAEITCTQTSTEFGVKQVVCRTEAVVIPF